MHKRFSFPKVMKSTAAATLAVTVILALLNHFFPRDWLLSAAISTGTVFYHFAMRLAVGAVVPKMLSHPGRRKWFAQRSLEPKLYKALRVKQWKDHTVVCLKRYTKSSFCSASSPCYLQFGGALSRCFASPLSSPPHLIAALPSCSDITAPDWFVFSQKRRRKPNE